MLSEKISLLGRGHGEYSLAEIFREPRDDAGALGHEPGVEVLLPGLGLHLPETFLLFGRQAVPGLAQDVLVLLLEFSLVWSQGELVPGIANRPAPLLRLHPVELVEQLLLLFGREGSQLLVDSLDFASLGGVKPLPALRVGPGLGGALVDLPALGSKTRRREQGGEQDGCGGDDQAAHVRSSPPIFLLPASCQKGRSQGRPHLRLPPGAG